MSKLTRLVSYSIGATMEAEKLFNFFLFLFKFINFFFSTGERG